MDILKYNKNFVKLIKMFNKHPYMFLNFLNKNNALTDSFKLKLSRANIKDKNNSKDLESTIEFYIHLLENDTIIEPSVFQQKEIEWNEKLLNAINNEQFEEAIKIRDYMNKKKYKIVI